MAKKTPAGAGSPLMVAPSLLRPDPGQPRQDADATALDALKESIQESGGILVPLIVAPDAEKGRYIIRAGWRRWRAATDLGLEAVPVIVDPDGSLLHVRVLQLAENSQRADLSRLEMAQSLHIIWLLQQVGALETEQGLDGQETSSLIGPDMRPTEQIGILRDRLCALAGVDSFRSYAQSGKVRVPWNTVLKVAGLSRLDDRERKRMLALLDLDLDVQDALVGIGKPVSERIIQDLQKLPPEDALAIVEEAGDAENPVSALNASLADRLPKDPPASIQETGIGDEGDEDQGDEDEGNEDGDPGYDLHHEAAPAQRPPAAYTPAEPTHKVPPPGRGTPPPDRSNGWAADPYTLLMAGFDSIRQGIELSGFAPLSDLQKREVRLPWREIVEALSYSGMELPDPASEPGDVRWPLFPDAKE